MPEPVRPGSAEIPAQKGNLPAPILATLLPTLQVLMCLSWSQAFRNTLGTLPPQMHCWASDSCSFATHMPPQSQSQYIWIILTYHIVCIVHLFWLCFCVISTLNIYLFSHSHSGAFNLSLHLIVFWDLDNTNPNNLPPSCISCAFKAKHLASFGNSVFACLKWIKWFSPMSISISNKKKSWSSLPSKSKTDIEATFQMCLQYSGLILPLLHWNVLALPSYTAWKSRTMLKFPAESGFLYAKRLGGALTNCDKSIQNLDQSKQNR